MKSVNTLRRATFRRAHGRCRPGGSISCARRRCVLEVESLETRLPLSLYSPTLELPGDGSALEGNEVELTAIFRDADPADTYVASIDWGDGTSQQISVSASPAFHTPLTVIISYSRDFNNFFDTLLKRDLLQLAADTFVSRLADNLAAIRPGPSNTWDVIFADPATGSSATLSNLMIGANEILLFAGGRELEAPSLGSGGFGGFNANGTAAFIATVKARGESGVLSEGNETDLGPWGGSIAFSTRSDVRWHFGETTEGLGPGETDFLTVAIHELGHLFGFGSAPSFQNLIDTVNNEFDGPKSVAEYDETGSPPLNSNGDHWAEGTADDEIETSMDPTIASNKRKLFSPLDFAAIDDLGWSIVPQRQGNIFGSHIYPDDGVYILSMTITDQTGREATESIEITVFNVAPVINATGTQSIHAGDLLSITDIATFTDSGFSNPFGSPATTESFTYVINWGDGSSLQNGAATVDTPGSSGTPTAGSFDATHTFASEGVFEVFVGVKDDEDGFDEDSFSVIVFVPIEAVLDEYSTDKDTPITQFAPGVLENDLGDLLRVTHVNGEASRVDTEFTLASGATVTLHQDGQLEYDPTTSATLGQLGSGQSAIDLFTYTTSDGRGAFSITTVEIEVTGQDEPTVVAHVDGRLVLELTTTQEHDQVGTLPDSPVWIDEWRPFWVELWVRVDGNASVGVASASTRLEFNTACFSVASVDAGSAFADDFNAEVDELAGRVDISATTDAPVLVGSGQHVLLARVALQATINDPGVPIGIDQAGPIQPVTGSWLDIVGPINVTLTGNEPAQSVQLSSPNTELWPLLYDLDDDGRISFGDLSRFASVFLDNSSTSPTAAKSDFDLSGSVSFGDLALFSANFLVSRTSDRTIVFPANFPEAWHIGAAAASASSAPSRMVLALAAEGATAGPPQAANWPSSAGEQDQFSRPWKALREPTERSDSPAESRDVQKAAVTSELYDLVPYDRPGETLSAMSNDTLRSSSDNQDPTAAEVDADDPLDIDLLDRIYTALGDERF